MKIFEIIGAIVRFGLSPFHWNSTQFAHVEERGMNIFIGILFVLGLIIFLYSFFM